MVYYRKYRPQKISELDNTHVRETLLAVLSSKNIPHAFLFTGSRGLGKTSTARIVAKVLNCEHIDQGIGEKGSIEPDNTCDQCVSITNGTNIDVLEIDGASNRGIDEIRSLRERVHLVPSNAKIKVYIIDEVHMLTTEAFNALLKTIEEPPAHSVFIFCTTESHKVPGTILSRCFHISFSSATNEEIVRSLERIKIGEEINIEKEQLLDIASMSEGGFRDAAKILEELVAINGKNITSKHFQSAFHTKSILLAVNNLLGYLNSKPKKTKESLEVVSSIVNQGIDLKFFITQILSVLHSMLLYSVGVETQLKSRPENISFTLDEIQILTALFSKAYQQTKYAVILQLPLELAIVEYCNFDQVSPERIGAQHTINAGKTTIPELLKKQQMLKVQQAITGSVSQPTVPADIKSMAGEQKDIHTQSGKADTLMENLIYKVKPYNHSVAGILRGCKISSYSDSEAIFITSYAFHKEQLEVKKTCEIIQKALKEITGKDLKVLVTLSK